MPKTNRYTTQIVLNCIRCGFVQSIWRLNSRLRGRDHTKHLYCPKCNRKTPHSQQEEYDQ